MKRLFMICLCVGAFAVAQAQMASVNITNNSLCTLDVVVVQENTSSCGSPSLAGSATLPPTGTVTITASAGNELTAAGVTENGCAAIGFRISPGSPSDVCGCPLAYPWNNSGPGCTCTTINGTWQATSCTTSDMKLF